MLKNLLEMYSGTLDTIRKHIIFDTPISQLLYETVGVPNTTFESDGEYYVPREEYEGYIGEVANREELPIVVGGVAEMLAKIMLIRELGLDEQKVYSCAAIKDAVTELMDAMHSLTSAEVKQLRTIIGREGLESLNERLDHGYITGFDYREDDMIKRAMWLFQLMIFHKYHEFKWFSFLGCLTNPTVVSDIRRLAKRIFEALLPIADGKEVDFFPKYGYSGRITAMGDIQIGDTLILISTLDKRQWTNEIFYRSAVILNACMMLARAVGKNNVKHKMVYHVRWNAFTKIA